MRRISSYLTPTGAAHIAGVSRVTVFRWIRSGRLVAQQIEGEGRKRPLYLIHPVDLRIFLEEIRTLTPEERRVRDE